jgi:predicted nucleic acid-binding protein
LVRSTETPYMSDRRFTLDTNVLLYALDRPAGQSHALAQHIIDRAVMVDWWLTLQASPCH